jgi:hypothetical protein
MAILFRLLCVCLATVVVLSACSAFGEPTEFNVTVVQKTASSPNYNKGNPQQYAFNGGAAPDVAVYRNHVCTFRFQGLDDSHPFTIGTSTVGGQGASVSVLPGQAFYSRTETFTWQADPTGKGTVKVYYQCIDHSYMGAMITVTDAPGSVPSSSTGPDNAASAAVGPMLRLAVVALLSIVARLQ